MSIVNSVLQAPSHAVVAVHQAILVVGDARPGNRQRGAGRVGRGDGFARDRGSVGDDAADVQTVGAGVDRGGAGLQGEVEVDRIGQQRIAVDVARARVLP